MMKNINKLSTELCYYLRHKPEEIGITLTKEGYVEVETFLQALRAKGTEVSLDTLQHIVDTDNKGRYGLLQNPLRIRCNQGHSTSQVDISHKTAVPPVKLYHGTATRNLESILKTGLNPGSRHQVHLSADIQTATTVGSRHGTPIILEVDAKTMLAQGFVFSISDNGVWLIDKVPASFLKVVE